MFPLVFPSSQQDIEDAGNTQANDEVVIEHEMLKGIVSVVDVVGLYFLFNAKRLINVMGDIDIKILSIGLGWAAAELLTTHFLDIILQSWSNEMKMSYVLQAIGANFDLLEIIGLAGFAYTLTRKETTESGSAKRFLIYALILARNLIPVANAYLHKTTEGWSEACSLEVKAFFAIAFFAASKYLR